jgi:VanZ family protein
VLAICSVLLIGGETAQLWIPSRSFTWADVLYSVLGVALAEACAMVIEKRARKS